MDEILANLFEGQELSDEFKEKVSAVIESEVEARVETAKEEAIQAVQEQADAYGEYIKEQLSESHDEVVRELAEKNERYMDYVAEQFMEQNQLAVTEGTKVEMADSFLKGLVGLAEQHNVVIPEGQENVISDLKQKLSDVETRFDEAIAQKEELDKQIKEMKSEAIVDDIASDLSESQKEKFANSASKIQFIDEAQYTEAVKGLFEAYYPKADGEQVNEEEAGKGEGTKVIKEEDDYFSSLVSQALKHSKKS